MRIRRLDLTRYGCFTDRRLDIPAMPADFHIVFGPNEAGKSTALSAIEDLLFGIDPKSKFGFLHEYKNMLLGAALENGVETIDVRRRKGNKDTLLTPGGVPVRGGEGALAPFLGGASEEFFTRMFSLDHIRLRRGGQEILDSESEVGQTLFSAGTGLSGLREKLRGLNAEAEELWAPRAQTRKYNQAQARLNEAEKAIREHTVTAANWQELRRAFDEAQKHYHTLDEARRNISHELRKLLRIRQIYNYVEDLSDTERKMLELGSVVRFPQNALINFDKAERELDKWLHQAGTLKLELEEANTELEGMKYDEELLLRESIILSFRDRRIEVRKERVDLPNREAELAAAKANIRRLASEAGLEGDDAEVLLNRIPKRAKVETTRALLNARGKIISAISNTRDGAVEVEYQITDLERKIKNMGEPRDISGLSAVLRAIRAGGDIASLIRSAGLEMKAAEDAAALHLKSLNPSVEENVLIGVSVPIREAVQNHRDERRSLDLRVKQCEEEIRGTGQELERYKKTYERLLKEGHAVSIDELVKAREARDTGWSLLKRRYVAGEAVPEAEIAAFTGSEASLTEAYESAVVEADTTADRRFDNAQSAAEITTISRQVAEKEELLESLFKNERALSEDSKSLEAAWRKMWEGAPFEPASPDSMLGWLAARSDIMRLVENRLEASRRLEALYNEESKAKASIIAELSWLAANESALAENPLGVIIEAASDILAEHDKKAALRKELLENLAKLEAEAERKRRALKIAKEEGDSWREKWAEALRALGISENTPPEEAAPKLSAIEEMREIAVEINHILYERIEKIKRDIENLTHDVRNFVSAAAKDLAAEDDTENAVIKLEQRLDETKRTSEQRKEKEKEISRLERRIKEAGDSAAEARETISFLQKSGRTENTAQLRDAILKSDKLRELEDKKQRLTDRLVQDGDGLRLEELIHECSGADIEQVRDRIEEFEEQQNDLKIQLEATAIDLSQKKKDFEALGGSGRAAEAASRKESAIAEMKQVAERYVRVRSAARMLEWAIDRYGREKQAPLLGRAGELFAALTNGSFSGLEIIFDENDRTRLAGVRTGGDKVEVSGMSDGTADQLYLALRIAAVEDYLESSNALPFIADDLFINFDDTRSAAGLKILDQLSRKTQVLFFTHHAHLVELARETLGESVNVVRL